jgi:hypothetical protein
VCMLHAACCVLHAADKGPPVSPLRRPPSRPAVLGARLPSAHIVHGCTAWPCAAAADHTGFLKLRGVPFSATPDDRASAARAHACSTMLRRVVCCSVLYAAACCMLQRVVCCSVLYGATCCMLQRVVCCSVLYVAACCMLQRVVWCNVLALWRNAPTRRSRTDERACVLGVGAYGGSRLEHACRYPQYGEVGGIVRLTRR